MKKIEDIAYGIYPDQKLDLYLPDQESFSTFVYFHGGGFEPMRDKTYGSVLAEYLAEHGIATVCVEYRRYPEAVYPEYIRDCAASVAWTHKNIEKYGISDKIYVGGSSAGGYASMMLCFDKRWFAPYRLPKDAVAGYFHDAGQPTTHFNILRERGMKTKKVVVDDAAPLYHIGDLPEYPPMHFVVSDEDLPSRYEQTMLVLSTLKRFGYDMSKITHEIMHGKHCRYIAQIDDEGNSVLGKLIYNFIMNCESREA